MCVRNIRALLAVVLVAMGSQRLAAQQADGLELERRGLYDQALAAYRRVLDTDRANVTAWLGMERVLGRVGHLESLIPLVDSVLLERPLDGFLRELEIRAWSTLGLTDSVEAAARDWIAAAPDSADPYRQWAFAVARQGDLDAAIEILYRGRQHLGVTALAAELARMLGSAGDWAGAAEEWGSAVAANEVYSMSAVAALRDAPPWARESALSTLIRPGAVPSAAMLAAELLVVWDRAEEGWTLLDSSLPSDRGRAVALLDRFVERARRADGAAAARARGYALERRAELSSGQEAERATLEAAQAFADAGELGGARRMLERLAESPGTTPHDAAEAMATVIRVTIELGRIDEADQRFTEWRDRMTADDVADLRRRLGQEWIGRGELERAERILIDDAGIGSLALLGWVRLYQGDLAAAAELFRAAGPYALSREEATRRTGMMALLQRIGADSSRALGKALLSLARGDTTTALDGLERVAGDMAGGDGRADILTWAGELAVTQSDYRRAEPLLTRALASDSTGPAAPAAEYALAVVLTRTGQPELAQGRLEHLILTYTESAVVPDARRLLNEITGAIPRS